MTLLKNRFIAGAATAALSFGIANAQDNNVMGAPTQQTSVSIPTPEQVRQTRVPMSDFRVQSDGSPQPVEVARSATAMASRDSIVVIAGGSDIAFLEQVREATRLAIAGGLPVRGMVVAGNDEGSFAEVYLLAFPYGPRDEHDLVIPIRPEDGDIKARVLDRLFEAEYQRPRILKEYGAEREALMTASREPMPAAQ